MYHILSWPIWAKIELTREASSGSSRPLSTRISSTHCVACIRFCTCFLLLKSPLVATVRVSPPRSVSWLPLASILTEPSTTVQTTLLAGEQERSNEVEVDVTVAFAGVALTTKG